MKDPAAEGQVIGVLAEDDVGANDEAPAITAQTATANTADNG